jgi:hypothetical protein
VSMARTSYRYEDRTRSIQALRSCISSRHDGAQLRISLAVCFATHLGLRLRPEEAHRSIDMTFGINSHTWCQRLAELKFAPEIHYDLIESKLDTLAKAFADIAWRPLTPRLVVAALGITGQERIRWTKDGRLPKSGQLLTRRGNGAVLQIPTYSVRLIDELAGHPETIIAWRERDAAAKRNA